jgi:hypothetical protein
MTHSNRLLLPYLLTLAAGCASGGGQRVYVAPTAQSVFAGYDEIASHPGQVMWVENRSSVPITIYSVTLRGCENVKQRCEVRPVNIHLGPNSRAELTRIEPENPQKAYNFSSTFAWRADSAPKAALGALASAGDTNARRELDLVRQAEAHRLHQVGAQDLDLTRAETDSLADRAGSLRFVPDSLVLTVGAKVPMDTVRVLLYSTENVPLGRLWTIQWRLRGDGVVTIVKPNSLMGAKPGRTLLQIRLNDDVLPGKASLHQAHELPIVVHR